MKKLLPQLRRLVIWAFFIQLAYILYVWVFPPPVTCTQLAAWIDGQGLQKKWVSFGSINPNAPLAVMAAEDQLFPDHNGFDWKSIEKALAYNKRKPGRVRGASTLSQQVAKNVFLWQGRSWFRKGLEVYFTFMIEVLYSKRRIMELYLNVAETGKGIFGVEMAARKYFGKSAAQLTRTEAAKIAACLPNPVKYTVKPLSGHVSSRSAWIIRQMNNLEGDPDVQAIIRH